MLRIFAIIIFSLLVNFSCGSGPIKTDIKSFEANPKEYKGKHVIIQTTIKDLNENPEAYFGKNVEVSGKAEVSYIKFTDWYFDLVDDEGQRVECYEKGYRNFSWDYATTMVRRFDRTKEKITVEGYFQKNRQIELDFIYFEDNKYIDTDYMPPRKKRHQL